MAQQRKVRSHPLGDCRQRARSNPGIAFKHMRTASITPTQQHGMAHTASLPLACLQHPACVSLKTQHACAWITTQLALSSDSRQPCAMSHKLLVTLTNCMSTLFTKRVAGAAIDTPTAAPGRSCSYGAAAAAATATAMHRPQHPAPAGHRRHAQIGTATDSKPLSH